MRFYLLVTFLKHFFYPKKKHVTYAFILHSLALSFSSTLVLPLVFLEPAFVFFVALVNSFRPLYFFFSISFCFFFSYVFLFYLSSKLNVSLPRWCLGVYCALISSSLLPLLLLSPLLSCRSSPPQLPSRTRLVVF